MSLELKEIIRLDDPPPPYESIREKQLQWKKPVVLITVVLIFVLLVGIAIGVYLLFISRSTPVPVAPGTSSNLGFTKEKLTMTEIRALPTNGTSPSTLTTTTPTTTVTAQTVIKTTKEVRKETIPSPTSSSKSRPKTGTTKIKTPSITTTTSDEYEYEEDEDEQDEYLESDAYEEEPLPIETSQPTTTTSTTTIITTGEPLIPWHQWDARDQEATVEGVLLCDEHPARGIKIKMYERDTFSADDKLAEVSTDGNGRFRVTGNSRELPGVRMNVHINFYHRCKQSSWNLCDYKSTLRVPNNFITSKGERPKVFQVGHLDLAKLAHTRDCFN